LTKLIYNPENRDRTFIRNVCFSPSNYASPRLRRPQNSRGTLSPSPYCCHYKGWLPMLRSDISWHSVFQDTMSHHHSILKGSDDLQTFEDDGRAVLRIFTQRLPCNPDSCNVTADSSTTPPW